MDQDDEYIETACSQCHQRNRLPRARLKDDPVCGRCKAKVFPRRAVPVTDADWKQEVEDSPLPILVDLWAPWCGPCRAVGPIVEQIAAERGGKLKVVKVNIDDNPRTAARFGVRSIPTLLILRGPLEVDRIVGALPKEALDARLDRVI